MQRMWGEKSVPNFVVRILNSRRGQNMTCIIELGFSVHTHVYVASMFRVLHQIRIQCIIFIVFLLFIYFCPFLSLCHHSLIFLLSVVVSPYESTVQCKYLVFMVCCCPACHKQNSLCHLSHCIYSSIINRFVLERKAEALAWR